MIQNESEFIYLTCKRESVPLLKSEMAKKFPDFRFSYSRPGFLTYKLPADFSARSVGRNFTFDIPSMRLVFASSVIRSLGTVRGKKGDGPDWDSMSAEFRRHLSEKEGNVPSPFQGKLPLFHRIHLWDPNSSWPSPEAERIYQKLWNALPNKGDNNIVSKNEPFRSIYNSVAKKGELCLDCVLVSENEWWIGYHKVTDYHSRFPGGLIPLVIPEDGTSRAWLKFEEGLRWSGFPIGYGSRCVDIGASPGGGSQVLLARGAEVLGVDPAEMAPSLLQNPNFTHLRGRIGQLKRKMFRKARWLIADMNVAPSYTLGVLEELVTAPDLSIRGLLFTMKLFNLDLADNIQSYIDQMKGWGFHHVKVRQLQFNRQEVMACAIKGPFHSR